MRPPVPAQTHAMGLKDGDDVLLAGGSMQHLQFLKRGRLIRNGAASFVAVNIGCIRTINLSGI